MPDARDEAILGMAQLVEDLTRREREAVQDRNRLQRRVWELENEIREIQMQSQGT